MIVVGQGFYFSQSTNFIDVLFRLLVVLVLLLDSSSNHIGLVLVLDCSILCSSSLIVAAASAIFRPDTVAIFFSPSSFFSRRVYLYLVTRDLNRTSLVIYSSLCLYNSCRRWLAYFFTRRRLVVLYTSLQPPAYIYILLIRSSPSARCLLCTACMFLTVVSTTTITSTTCLYYYVVVYN